MRITALAVGDRAFRIAELLRDRSGGKIIISRSGTAELPLITAELLANFDAVIMICSMTEAIRSLSGLDYPAINSVIIIQIDEYAKYVVPLAPVNNRSVIELVKQVAGVLGAIAVVSEPTQLETFAIDKWANAAGLRIANPEALRIVQDKLMSGMEVHYDSVFPISGALPPGITEAKDWQESDFTVSYLSVTDEHTLLLVPPVLSLGIDSPAPVEAAALSAAFDNFLERSGCHPLALGAVCCFQSSPLASAVAALCRERSFPFKAITQQQLSAAEAHFAQNRYPFFPASDCEKCAVLGLGGALLVRRYSVGGIGFALAVLEPVEI